MGAKLEGDTRERLLVAAAEEFAQYGLKGARIQAIVKRARINERMIYHHFESKDGLYRAVLDDQWSALTARLGPALTALEGLPPREGIRRAFLAIAGAVRETPLLGPLAMHEAMGGWKSAAPVRLSQLPRGVRALFERGQRDGTFRADADFELLYLSMVGAILSVDLIAPRFLEVRKGAKQDPRFAGGLGEQVVNLVLDGVTTARKR